VRQPVAKLQVAVPAAVKGRAFADLLDILAAEVNAKGIEVAGSDHDLVRLKGKAEFRSLGSGTAGDAACGGCRVAAHAEQLQALERGELVRAGEFEFHPVDVTVTREVVSDWPCSRWPVRPAVDPRLTADLVKEGLAREVVKPRPTVCARKRATIMRRASSWVWRAQRTSWPRPESFQAFVEGETLAAKTLLGGVLPDGRPGTGGGHRRTPRDGLAAAPRRTKGRDAIVPTKSPKSKAKAKSKGMGKKQLSHLEKRLLEERARVMKELGHYDESFNSSLQASDGDLSSYSFHMADQGTDAMEREKAFLFASQEDAISGT